MQALARCGLVAAIVLSSLAEAREDPTSAHARARVLNEEGLKQYNLGHHQDALKAFEEAYLAEADPKYLFDIGQCYRQVGDPAHAAYSYKAYLAARPEAANREEVEKLIATAEQEIQRRQAEAPPVAPITIETKPAFPVVAPPATTVTGPVPPQVPLTPEPSATTVTTIYSSPPPAEAVPVYRRWWLWVAVGVVLVGAAVATGVASAPSDAAIPSTSLGAFSYSH